MSLSSNFSLACEGHAIGCIESMFGFKIIFSLSLLRCISLATHFHHFYHFLKGAAKLQSTLEEPRQKSL